MIISVIVAASENNVIGKDGGLPWHLPLDMKFFRKKTMGHPIIMGRKTFESIGHPLPDRLNVVITRQEKYSVEHAVVVSSLKEALRHCEKKNFGEVFVIGGGEIYKSALPLANNIFLTRVHTEIEGDVFFPDIPEFDWKEVKSKKHKADNDHEYAFTFLTYIRTSARKH